MNREAKTGRLRETSAFITGIGGAIRSHVGAVAANSDRQGVYAGN